MEYAVAIVLSVVALVDGLIGNRWWLRSHGEADEGFGIGDLFDPVTTHAVVLMTFIVVEALSS